MKTGNHYIMASGVEIRFHQETEVVESMHGTRKPDPAWKHMDSAEHIHSWWEGLLPTLYEKVTGTVWVGDEIDGSEVEVTEYRCKSCDEVVVPGFYTDYSPITVKGPSAYSLVLKPQLYESEWRIPEEDVGPLIDILRRVFV